MTFFRYGNRRSARAQAAFVALLYVFLSTFGTLTHTHAWFGDEVNTTEHEASAASTAGGSHHLTVGHDASGTTHCAFCDWQANSVSAALPIQHCVLPSLVALALPHQIVIPITVRIVHTSSRAPPIA